MHDDRLNLPSASNASADSLCPGRHLVNAKYPDAKSEYADYGDAIHRAMRGDEVELTEDQQKTVAMASEIEDRTYQAWVRDNGRDLVIHREKRLWRVRDGKKQNSGQADVFWIQGNRALLADYKTLFGEVEEAAQNMQLRDLVVLIHLNYGCTEVTAYINQPRVTRNPTLVVYDMDAIDQAFDDMCYRVAVSMNSNSPRIAGEAQCKHCKGKLDCQEFQRDALKPMDLLPIHSPTLKPKALKPELGKVVAALDSDRLVQLRDVIVLTRMLDDAVDAEIRSRLAQDALSVPGMTLEPGNNVRSVKSALAAYENMSEVLTPEDFNECCSVSIGKIENAYRKKKGCTHDEAKAAVTEILASCIEYKSNVESLRRLKQ